MLNKKKEISDWKSYKHKTIGNKMIAKAINKKKEINDWKSSIS